MRRARIMSISQKDNVGRQHPQVTNTRLKARSGTVADGCGHLRDAPEWGFSCTRLPRVPASTALRPSTHRGLQTLCLQCVCPPLSMYTQALSARGLFDVPQGSCGDSLWYLFVALGFYGPCPATRKPISGLRPRLQPAQGRATIYGLTSREVCR